MTSADGRKSLLSELACHKMIAIAIAIAKWSQSFNKTILVKIEFGRRTQYIKNFISKNRLGCAK